MYTYACVCVHMYGKQYMVNRYTIQPTYMNFCIILTSNKILLNVHIICFSSLCNAKPFSPLPIYTEHFILIPDPHEIHGHMCPIVLTFISGNQNIPHSIKSTCITYVGWIFFLALSDVCLSHTSSKQKCHHGLRPLLPESDFVITELVIESMQRIRKLTVKVLIT